VQSIGTAGFFFIYFQNNALLQLDFDPLLLCFLMNTPQGLLWLSVFGDTLVFS
jgi:hypothetical protein